MGREGQSTDGKRGGRGVPIATLAELWTTFGASWIFRFQMTYLASMG
jgi:hypothetical protein